MYNRSEPEQAPHLSNDVSAIYLCTVHDVPPMNPYLIWICIPKYRLGKRQHSVWLLVN